VINQMNGGALPDLLGLCEVENKAVLKDLVDRLNRPDYEIAHDDSPDLRGIDATLIYSKNVFELVDDPVGHVIHLRYPTRDVFEVPLRVKTNNKELTVLVCHWPSRSQGQYESEPLRITVAERCGALVDRIVKFPRDEFPAADTEASLATLNERWNRNVLLMGDLNDEPFNRSVLDYLRASKGLDHLEEPLKKSDGHNIPSLGTYLGKKVYMFNCMWPLMAKPDSGTYHYSSATNTMNFLDQFIISRGLYYGLDGLQMDQGSVTIFKTPELAPGTKERPKRFTFKKDKQTGVVSNNGGYSDHLPVLSKVDTV
jgi:hypothetical protein